MAEGAERWSSRTGASALVPKAWPGSCSDCQQKTLTDVETGALLRTHSLLTDCWEEENIAE